ncbi:S41 family peptidase [Nannocystis punicea]|uniref:S41 family peptidase n=1 Tax=Nannocystis punicea TaxID=2995304 RepID=A0ABY7H3Q2_9BACT|nr:S41 family peptidase [Nannocystis poenicansa]WAS93882.1 S41 family peptidase [Nannocystis poenicansa]
MNLVSRWRSFLAFSLGAATMWCVQSGLPDAQAGNSLGTDAYGKALRTVLDRYVDPVEPGRVLAESLKRIVSGLDRHSHYLTADERALLKQRSRGGTTGMIVEFQRAEPGSRKPARLEVSAVLPGSPAEKIGLQPGDSILKIRDQDIGFMLSRAEVDVLLLGGEGETIDLTVQRRSDAGPTSQRLVLSGQSLPVVSGALVEHGGRKFAHVRIRAFRSGVADSVRNSLKELRRSAGAAGIGGVVLDVRGNPGGDVGEAVLIADTFVGEGVLVRTRGRGGQILREERATQAATDDATKVVVLQDHRSASASELLAIALQDHGRAKVIGERSYGKGTVQDVIGLDDGSVLTLTIARYFSPKDRLIDGVGVEPDVPVADMTTQPEAALRAALSAL